MLEKEKEVTLNFKSEQTSNISLFKKLGNIFAYMLGNNKNNSIANKEIVNNKEDDIKVKRKAIQEKVDSLLENSLESIYPILISYLESGYELTQKQKGVLFSNIVFLEQNDGMNLLISSSKTNIINDDNYLAKMLPFYIAHTERNNFSYDNKYQTIKKMYEEKLSDPEFASSIFNTWITDVNSLLYMYTPLDILKGSTSREKRDQQIAHIYNRRVTPLLSEYSKEMFKDKKLEDILSLSQEILKKENKYGDEYTGKAYAKYMKDLSNSIIQKAETACRDNIEKTKSDIRAAYSNEHINDLINSQAKKIMTNISHKVNSLPNNAQDIINNIKNEYNLLQKNINNFTTVETFDINNLLEKRMPEVINKYLLLDDDYKSTMRHSVNNKTAEDLLLESLDSIFNKSPKCELIRIIRI